MMSKLPWYLFRKSVGPSSATAGPSPWAVNAKYSSQSAGCTVGPQGSHPEHVLCDGQGTRMLASIRGVCSCSAGVPCAGWARAWPLKCGQHQRPGLVPWRFVQHTGACGPRSCPVEHQRTEAHWHVCKNPGSPAVVMKCYMRKSFNTWDAQAGCPNDWIMSAGPPLGPARSQGHVCPKHVLSQLVVTSGPRS